MDIVERLQSCLRFDKATPVESELEAASREAISEIARLRTQAQHETDCAEAYRAEADRLRDENTKLHALLADRAADHSHECIACHLSYTPTKHGYEDCPACGCDGTDEWVQTAMRKGE